MRNFIENLKRDRYKYLVDILFLIALVQFLLLVFGARTVIPEESFLFDTVVRISGIFMVFLQGCAGFVIMIRQEFRQIITIRGRVAQLFGLIIWAASWLLALSIIIYTIRISF